jgi:hypothetical protein
MLNYCYGISHGMTTVYKLFTTADIHDSMSINLESGFILIYLYLFLIFSIEYLFLIIYKFPSVARGGSTINNY